MTTNRKLELTTEYPQCLLRCEIITNKITDITRVYIRRKSQETREYFHHGKLYGFGFTAENHAVDLWMPSPNDFAYLSTIHGRVNTVYSPESREELSQIFQQYEKTRRFAELDNFRPH